MEFNVTRVTYQTMHLHPKIYFQPCPSNTSVLIVSPEFAYEKDRHVAIFSLSSSGERPRRWHWKFGTKTIRVNAPLVRTPARLESNLNEPPTTKKCKSSRQSIPLLRLLLLVKFRQSLLSKGIASFKDSIPSFKQNKIETLAGDFANPRRTWGPSWPNSGGGLTRSSKHGALFKYAVANPSQHQQQRRQDQSSSNKWTKSADQDSAPIRTLQTAENPPSVSPPPHLPSRRLF